MTLVEPAMKYEKMGLSVIPIRPDKKPYAKWTEYQKRRATPDEIREWLKQWPDCMLGIVTGSISGIFVIDCDSEEAYQEIQKHIPDNLVTCVAKTPRGYHIYFRWPKDKSLSNATGIMPGVDVRGEGGYVIAPESVNGTGGRYEWLDGLSIFETQPAEATDALYKYIFKYIYRACKENIRTEKNSLQFLTQGTRDNDLFHVGNCLIKGGCKEEIARQVLDILASNCNPPFPEKEAQTKIDSVLNRCERRERNLTEELRRWIDLTSAYFSLTEAYDPLQILTSQKNTVHQIMHRFVKEGYVERHPNKNGVYRRIDSDIEFMDFLSADPSNSVKLTLPLGIDRKTKLFPKAVIVIAGVSGMGKTLFALNCIAENMGKHQIFYFNSEMGPEAFKEKLSHFPIPIEQWAKGMRVIDNWDFHNIPDKIQPDAFNVIDYLEPEGEKAFNIHGVISAIIRRLNKGIALICIQKKPDAKMGIGGIYSIKASTLALSLDWGRIEIVKNRFREADQMPSLSKINFEVYRGHKFVPSGTWYR